MTPEALPDIPRLATAGAEWGACLVYVLRAKRRFGWGRLAPVLAAGAVVLAAIQLVAGSLPLAFWTPGMLAAVAAMFALLHACLDAGWRQTAALTARAFVLAELVASLHWQLHTWFSPDGSFSPASGALIAVVYAAGLGLALLAERRHLPGGEIGEVNGREVIGAAAIAAATFAISNLSFTGASTPFSARLGHELFYIRTLVDLCGFIALYAQQEWRREIRTRAENAAMAQLLRGQHEQYYATRRAIEEAARTQHDMKHAIQTIRAEQDPALRSRLVDELERRVEGDGTLFRTGSAVLDAVLHAKAMGAREQGVDITCVADGSLLAGWRDLDIVTVAGNALDNAIESAAQVEDPDRRAVRVALFARDGFAMLRVENAYDGVLRRSGERILTRKADAAAHGYGLRSIERTAADYDGSVSISADDDWFSLRVLFPR